MEFKLSKKDRLLSRGVREKREDSNLHCLHIKKGIVEIANGFMLIQRKIDYQGDQEYLLAANDIKNDVDDKKSKYVRYVVDEKAGAVTAYGEITAIHPIQKGKFLHGKFTLEKLFPKRKPKFKIALSRSLLLQFLNCLDKNDETLRFYFYGKDKQVKITSENETIKAIIMPMFVQWEDSEKREEL